MEEDRILVTFVDDDGNEFNLEEIDYFEYEGKQYGVLIDPELPDDAEYFEICIMEITVNEEEDIEEYIPVEDEVLMDKLFELAKKRMELWDEEEEE